MNEKSSASVPTTAAPATAQTAAPPIDRQIIDSQALVAALAGIRADSRRESDTYLRDTVVPHGGE